MLVLSVDFVMFACSSASPLFPYTTLFRSSEGGPTGLFTIYDGSTLRRGEFTFSIAYSNYDRDPGNVDIVDIPLSFNVGLNDQDRKSTRLNSSHLVISYAVFCLKKKKT